MSQAKIGVIGGTGLYRIEGMTDIEEVTIHTPFGDPSDVITIGKVSGVAMAFLPRHGRGHRISPTEIPVRANLWALKSLGVEWVISVSAVGSLREDIAPRDLVIPDQLYDRTKSRINSFFEQGIVAHCAFAEPFCPTLSKLLLDAAYELNDVKVHAGRNLYVYRRSSFLYPCRISDLSQARDGYYWNDGSARSQASTRSRIVLCNNCLCY